MGPTFKGSTFRRINWLLLLVHLLALGCLILGGQSLVEMVKEYQRQGYQSIGPEEYERITGPTELRFTFFWLLTGHLVTWFLAILLGCWLSAIVVRRRQESAAIPLLLFSGAVALSWPHFYEPGQVVHRLPGLLHFPYAPRHIEWGLAGGLLVVLGLVFFLLTWSRPRAVLLPKANG